MLPGVFKVLKPLIFYSPAPLSLLPFSSRRALLPATVAALARHQSTAAPSPPPAPPSARGGRLDNAVDFVTARLDDLVNWARKVSWNSFSTVSAQLSGTL